MRWSWTVQPPWYPNHEMTSLPPVSHPPLSATILKAVIRNRKYKPNISPNEAKRLIPGLIFKESSQIIIFHQPRFHWNKGIFLPKRYLLGAQVVWGRYNLTRIMVVFTAQIGPGRRLESKPLSWTTKKPTNPTWMSRWKWGSMGYNLIIDGVYWGYNPLILTLY